MGKQPATPTPQPAVPCPACPNPAELPRLCPHTRHRTCSFAPHAGTARTARRRHRPRHHHLPGGARHERQGDRHADEQEERLPGAGGWVGRAAAVCVGLETAAGPDGGSWRGCVCMWVGGWVVGSCQPTNKPTPQRRFTLPCRQRRPAQPSGGALRARLRHRRRAQQAGGGREQGQRQAAGQPTLACYGAPCVVSALALLGSASAAARARPALPCTRARGQAWRASWPTLHFCTSPVPPPVPLPVPQVYIRRVRKYLGAYFMHLGGRVDAIVFSAGEC